jgi:tetratricopeptide (TPR) repeat protein/tRNA A-37 threonylcarbamoyl transferase component Bud32
VTADPDPTRLERSARPTASDTRSDSQPFTARLVTELGNVVRTDPLFSPLTELALSHERMLGEGGMGAVHLVTDRRLGRRAALKLLKGDATERRVRRFLREAAITARLDHPGIPPVHEVGRTTGGVHFILMRFVDGRSLEQLLAGKGRPERAEFLRVLVKVGEAVAYAHDRRIVHRDLKPANVMVGSFGEVLVMDWGIARDLDASPEEDANLDAFPEAARPLAAKGLTQAGAVMGTIGYMSPEQAKGARVDARADIFALGAILAEVLTGVSPIPGDTAQERFVATVEGRVAPLAVRGTPPELVAIAARALRADPAARYPTAGAFAADLRAYLEGREVSVYRYGALRRVARLARRHPVLATGLLVALLLSTVTAVVVSRKNVELATTLAAYEREAHERALAERDRDAGDKATGLLAQARTRHREGASPEDVRRSALAAVAARRSESVLLDAGRLLAETGQLDEGKALLRACADEFPPGYAALYSLHEIEWGLHSNSGHWLTEPLKELVARARARHEENEFTALALASEALERKDWKTALEKAEVVQQRAPRFVASFIVAATARTELGDLDAALADANRALEVDPGSIMALVCRGVVRDGRRDLDGAIQDITRALTLAPGFAYLWANRAKMRLDAHDLDGAIQDADRAIALSPDLADAWRNRGGARVEKREFEGALADAERCAELDPSAQSFCNRAMVRRKLGDERGAAADIERALALDPLCAPAYQQRGSSSIARSDFASALEDESKAIELDPRLPLPWALRAGIRSQMGDQKGGLADCEKALELDPRSYEAWSNRGVIHTALKQYDEAARDLSKALELGPPHDGAIYVNRGNIYLLTGDREKALADFEKAVEFSPQYYTGWASRGLVRQQTGDLEGAIADFTKALEINPNLALALLQRGRARAERGDVKGAIEDLERFLAFPDYPQEKDAARKKLAELRGR